MNKHVITSLILSMIWVFTFAQAPTGLSGTAYRTTVRLQWNDYTAFTPVGYNIYRSTVNNTFGTPARRIGAYNDYTDYGLTSGATYYYKISAFDANGTESPLSTQFTIATNDNHYLKVANLDLLIPIYTGGMETGEADNIRQSLEFARLFFFRNSKGQLNLKFHFMEIPGSPPFNADNVADFGTIGTDLHNRGILDNQYDAIHVESYNLYGWYGGAQWFGQTAGSMAHYPGYVFYAGSPYSEGDPWVFTHEFGHSLDGIIADGSGFPEMLFNHFPPPGNTVPVPDFGTNFDGMSYILRTFQHHLNYAAPWDGYFEVVDNDTDGLADFDNRLPANESSFGSSVFTDDSDLDGVTDLKEFYTGNFSGSNPNNADSDGDGLPDGNDPYPISNFSRYAQKTTNPVAIDGTLGASEGWQPLVSNPFFSKVPGLTLSTYTTWDDTYFYFAFKSNHELKYYLNLDCSGEDGPWYSPIRFPGGDYSTSGPNAFGDAYFESEGLIIRADATQVVRHNVAVAGSQVSNVLSNGIYTTEVRIPKNLGPGWGWSYSPPGSPVVTTQNYTTNDTIGVDIVAIPLSEATGNETGDWQVKNMTTLNEMSHFYDMILTGSPAAYCTSQGNALWEDWIKNVSLGSINNNSGKSKYSDYTSLSTNLTPGVSTPLHLSTAYSYTTYDEYWKVWIDYNHNGVFEEPGELAYSGIQPKPANGTPSVTLNGAILVPASAQSGSTRMRVSMKRGAYPTPCENFAYGEVEDYSVNIQGTPTFADLELTATANPTTIGSGDVQYQLTLSNKGPLTATNITVKHTPNGNFAIYSQVNASQGSFNTTSKIWSIPSLGSGQNATLSFTGLIVDMMLPQSDFFEVMTSTPGDPDSSPGNDNGAKIANEDDEALINLIPAGAPDLIVNSANLPASGVAGSTYTFSVSIKNNGALPAANVFAGGYLSSDNQWSANDVPLANVTLGAIPPAGTVSGTGTFTIPAGTAAGNYYIIILADPQNTIVESNEGNNASSFAFQVTGGGGTVPYCTSVSNFPWEDWIAGVQLNTINNPSGKSAYSNFTSQSTALQTGVNYNITLTTGYSYFTFNEYWVVWVDLNHDGVFSSPNEVVLQTILTAPANGTASSSKTVNFTLPGGGLPGATRMRISMKRGAFPTACETLPYGEVEDYTVNIGAGSGCTTTFTTGNIQCNDNNTPLNGLDDLFYFDVLASGSGAGPSWQMTWNGGSTTGTYGVVKTVGPFSIASYQGGFNFTIADPTHPGCSATGSVNPPPPCAIAPATCGFSKTYTQGSGYAGISAIQTASGYEVVGSKYPGTGQVSFIEVNTTQEGVVTSSVVDNIATTSPLQVIRLKDGNYVHVSIINYSLKLEKKAPNGALIWSKTYDPLSNRVQGVFNVIEGPGEDLMVLGKVGVYPNYILQGIFALKTNSQGVQLWQTLNNLQTQPGNLDGKALKPTADGGYLINFIDLNYNNLVGKLDVNGNLLWQTQVSYSPLNPVNVATESSNGSILVSYTGYNLSGPANDVVYFTKLSSTGQVLWNKNPFTIFGIIYNPNYIDYAYPFVAPAPNGGFTVAFTGPGGLYLAGINASDSVTWTKIHAISPKVAFLDRAVNGAYLLTGSLDDKLWLMTTDAQGNICTAPPPGQYCASYSNFPWEDWIAGVQINTLNNPSGKSVYSDFTSKSTTLQVGTNYNITLTTGFSYYTYNEYWKIWVDVNHDGVFSSPNEVVLETILTAPANGTPSASKTVNFTLPGGGIPGSTRMRISMKRGAFATACEVLPFGEVEDYTVIIPQSLGNTSLSNGIAALTFEATANENNVSLHGAYYEPGGAEAVAFEKSTDGEHFEPILTVPGNQVDQIQATDEEPIEGANYYRMVLHHHDGAFTFSPIRTVAFYTLGDVTIYPNPASSEIFVRLNGTIPAGTMLQIIDDHGRLILTHQVAENDNNPGPIALNGLGEGMYFLFVQREGKLPVGRKFLILR